MSTLIDMQRAFAARIRQPNQAPEVASVNPERMQVYEQLVYNNLDDLLRNAFPICSGILALDQWGALIRGFLATHPSKTPFFYEIPEAFLTYLMDQKLAPYPPYLIELAHYEWVGLVLDLSPEVLEVERMDHSLDLATHPIVLSPLSWLLTYQYPVHTITPETQPNEVAKTLVHLLGYRDQAHRVHFLQINHLTRRLLELIESVPSITAKRCAEQLAQDLQSEPPNDLLQKTLSILGRLRENHILWACQFDQNHMRYFYESLS